MEEGDDVEPGREVERKRVSHKDMMTSMCPSSTLPALLGRMQCDLCFLFLASFTLDCLFMMKGRHDIDMHARIDR